LRSCDAKNIVFVKLDVKGKKEKLKAISRRVGAGAERHVFWPVLLARAISDLFDLFPEPTVCRIILHTLMPVQMSLETGRLEREGIDSIHRSRGR
jgi:hypothetical protein